jgi:NAD+ synthase
MKSPEKVKKHITNWLETYSNKSNTNGFVIGISGGIDSAVTSTLCALTNKPVLCLEMSIYQNSNEVKRSSQHIKWLENKFKNVSHHKLSLTGVFEQFQSTMPKSKESQCKSLSLANTRARLRMTSLYYFATLNKYLVAGTGNKVEDFGVGFYTKYGDGGVDISPIANLLKTEVFSLGKHLNIISSIQNAAPTDGLWEDSRTDEDQLGVSYADLEWAMKVIEQKKELINTSEKEKKIIKTFKEFNKKNKHKMISIPVCEIPDNFL